MPTDPKAKGDELTAADLKKLKRDDLNEAAAEAGVPNPDELANKDEVIEAIQEPNPALAPVPDEPGEQTYTVVGPVEVHGHKPGSDFTAELPPEQEALLIESGHIKRTHLED